ncbi:MAG: hypothetical protein H6807_10600 [Planctomycetes bacterium]|nr:hypothetical protein [Planctomycetota bacterium]
MRTTLTTLFVGLLALAVQAQTTLTVPSASYPTIQSAVSAAAPGDTVAIGPGTYQEHVFWLAGDIKLVGAGVGQTIIDGTNDGPCLHIDVPLTAAAVIEGITFQNGYGPLLLVDLGLNFYWAECGGGILIESNNGPASPTIRDCRITGCYAEFGSAIAFLGSPGAAPVFERVEIDNCSGELLPPADPPSLIHGRFGRMTLSGCRIHDNDVYNLIHWGVIDSSIIPNPLLELVLNEVEIDHNVTRGAIATFFQSGVLHGCRIHHNGCLPVFPNSLPAMFGCYLADAGSGVAPFCDFSELAIEGNVDYASFFQVVTQAGLPAGGFRNCSLIHNQMHNQATALVRMGSYELGNSILHDNPRQDGTVPANAQVDAANPNPLRNCCLDVAQVGSTACIVADPLLVDGPGGDLRLASGSPCLDAGTTAVPGYLLGTGVSTDDLFGRPRIRGAQVDIGAIEAREGAVHPAADGTVGAGSGGPHDVLLLNGTTGNALREVRAGVGSSLQFTVAQPPHLATAVDFSIFGMLAEAEIEQVINVPLGVGPMSFLPAPLAPYLQPVFFTAASSIGSFNGVAPLTMASPTPWTSGAFSIPFALDLSFQAVLEEAPGLYTVSNLVVLKVD